MSKGRGKGGKIAKWKKTGTDSWVFQGNADLGMDIDSKPDQGHRVRLKGKSWNGPSVVASDSNKDKARSKAADIRRRISDQVE